MQDPIAPITIALIGVTVYLSWRGFKNGAFFDKYSFRIDSILGRKEYYRVISSGFLHTDLPHLIFNAFCFYSFAEGIELLFGKAALLSIYFLSLVGGGLLSLLIHRNHHDYTAVGASGAVSGIICSLSRYPSPRQSLRFCTRSFQSTASEPKKATSAMTPTSAEQLQAWSSLPPSTRKR